MRSAFYLAGCCFPAVPRRTTPGPNRPPIIGVAHIGLKTSDLAAAQKFYGDVLGFDHFSLDKPTGGLMLNYYKVNDHQYMTLRSSGESEMPWLGALGAKFSGLQLKPGTPGCRAPDRS